MSGMWREGSQYAAYQGEGPDDWPACSVCGASDHDADLHCEYCGRLPNENALGNRNHERDQLQSKLAQAEARVRALEDAGEALKTALDAVENSPSYRGVWGFLHAHGYKYIGPSWAEAKEAFFKTLEGRRPA